MKKFGNDYWVGSEWRQNYMSSFWLVLFSSWILYNGALFWIWRVFRIANIAWAVPSPKETCDFCSIGAKISISSSRTRELDEDDDDKTSCSSRSFFCFWRWRWWTFGTTFIKDRVDKRKACIWRRTRYSHTITKKKRTSSLARPICHTGTRFAEKLAWAIRRSVDFRQRSRRWSSSQHHL